MNPVKSYRDFKHFMRWQNGNKPIPILLIRPDVLLSFLDEHRIGRVLDYYNHYTGNDIVFFLPGYSHYPNQFSSISGFFPPSRPREGDTEIVYYDYQDKQKHYIQTNERDFVDFIKTLSERAEGFQYFGDTELLLPTYISGKDYEEGDLDFSSLAGHRYNLTQLFLSKYNHYGDKELAFRCIENFLHDVCNALVQYDPNHFYNSIDRSYMN